MAQLPDYLTPDLWLEQLFSSGEARKGGVVKRQIRDVERLVGRTAFADAVRGEVSAPSRMVATSSYSAILGLFAA